jgi:hypothetical protein
MLTLAEIESTLQIEYELQLEALGEQALRDLPAEPAGFRQLAPRHLSDAEVRTIAEATLAELVPRKAPASELPALPGSPWNGRAPDLCTAARRCTAQIVAREALFVSSGSLLTLDADLFFSPSSRQRKSHAAAHA